MEKRQQQIKLAKELVQEFCVRNRVGSSISIYGTVYIVYAYDSEIIRLKDYSILLDLIAYLTANKIDNYYIDEVTTSRLIDVSKEGY